MPANTAPIYGLTPNIGNGTSNAIIGTSANTATDGTGANTFQIFAAGANGAYVYKVILKPVSTIAATVARLWYLNDTGTFSWNNKHSSQNPDDCRSGDSGLYSIKHACLSCL